MVATPEDGCSSSGLDLLGSAPAVGSVVPMTPPRQPAVGISAAAPAGVVVGADSVVAHVGKGSQVAEPVWVAGEVHGPATCTSPRTPHASADALELADVGGPAVDQVGSDLWGWALLRLCPPEVRPGAGQRARCRDGGGLDTTLDPSVAVGISFASTNPSLGLAMYSTSSPQRKVRGGEGWHFYHG